MNAAATALLLQQPPGQGLFSSGLCAGISFMACVALLFLIVNSHSKRAVKPRQVLIGYIVSITIRYPIILALLFLAIFVIKVNPVGFIVGMSATLVVGAGLLLYWLKTSSATTTTTKEQVCSQSL